MNQRPSGWYWGSTIDGKRQLVLVPEGWTGEVLGLTNLAPVATENDVRELVEALSNLALCGFEDTDPRISYVNLQADRADIQKAREVLAKWEDKK